MATDSEKTLKKILAAENTDKTVMAGAVLELIRAAPETDRPGLMALALTERGTLTPQPFSLPNKGLASDRWNELNDTHLRMLLEFLGTAFHKARKADDFASQVLRFLDFLESEDERVFCLAQTLYSPFVPFLELPGEIANISDQRFTSIVEASDHSAKLLKYIAGLPLKKTTEVASLVLPVLDNVDDKEARIVLLAAFIGHSLSRFKPIEA